MRIYLDNCCYGRPYDKQDSDKIIDETMSLRKIFKSISIKNIELATSYILHYENNKKNDIDIKTKIFEFMKYNRTVHIGIENVPKLTEMTAKIMETGVKTNDAYHVASAILANCDYFLTTDRRLLKYQSDKITLMNPVNFVKILEADKND